MTADQKQLIPESTFVNDQDYNLNNANIPDSFSEKDDSIRTETNLDRENIESYDEIKKYEGIDF